MPATAANTKVLHNYKVSSAPLRPTKDISPPCKIFTGEPKAMSNMDTYLAVRVAHSSSTWQL